MYNWSMAIDFPNDPVNGQSFTINNRTWQYDGEKWVFVDAPTVLRDTLIRIYMEVF